MQPQPSKNIETLLEDFDDFFETAVCGFVLSDGQGFILRANEIIAEWMNSTPAELKGKRFSDLFSIGGKIYYETHLSPLLRLQGFFDEVVLELKRTGGEKLRVMVNGLERRNADGTPCFIRYTILKARDRLQYERNLQDAKIVVENELAKQQETVILREQLIAVLGHDLRNPLSAIKMAVDVLATDSVADNAKLLGILKRSTARMTELVKNIMDFARTRMGEKIQLSSELTVLEPVLAQVVAEMKLAYPLRKITSSLEITEPVYCDPYRISQLLSNLIANALTHGAPNSPVHINAFHLNGLFELSVSNEGVPIPEDLRGQLFNPFTKQGNRPSQNGLGLGLYICSEIAEAHNGTLSFISDAAQTCFTFRIAQK